MILLFLSKLEYPDLKAKQQHPAAFYQFNTMNVTRLVPAARTRRDMDTLVRSDSRAPIKWSQVLVKYQVKYVVSVKYDSTFY